MKKERKTKHKQPYPQPTCLANTQKGSKPHKNKPETAWIDHCPIQDVLILYLFIKLRYSHSATCNQTAQVPVIEKGSLRRSRDTSNLEHRAMSQNSVRIIYLKNKFRLGTNSK